MQSSHMALPAFDWAGHFQFEDSSSSPNSRALVQADAANSTPAVSDALFDQFHFGDMGPMGLSAQASGLTPAISGFGSDHFQFVAMDSGFHQAPIAHPLDLDLQMHQAPLQEIVEAAAPAAHEVTPVTAEVSPVASVLDVIHAIHAHTA